MECPCVWPDVDPETDSCDCGHVLDEHDARGICQVELPDIISGHGRAAAATGDEGGRVERS